jgi:hypothetical protein
VKRGTVHASRVLGAPDTGCPSAQGTAATLHVVTSPIGPEVRSRTRARAGGGTLGNASRQASPRRAKCSPSRGAPHHQPPRVHEGKKPLVHWLANPRIRAHTDRRATTMMGPRVSESDGVVPSPPAPIGSGSGGGAGITSDPIALAAAVRAASSDRRLSPRPAKGREGSCPPPSPVRWL